MRFETIAMDLSGAVRQMRRAPGLTLLATVCLGLGIGINTAVFSAVNAVLLRPIGVADPDRLVSITRNQHAPWSFPAFEQARSSVHRLAGLAASMPMESDLDVAGNSDFVTAEAVTSNYGDVVRPRLLLGRWFSDDREASAVISEQIWERRFHRTPDVLGGLIRSQSESYTIVGVAAATFTGVFAPLRTDLWVPIRSRPSLEPLLANPRPNGLLMVFGRRLPETSLAQVGDELRTLDRRLSSPLARDTPEPAPVMVDTVRGIPNGASRQRLTRITTLLAAVVAIVLLIACVNVGNLLLSRGTTRQREFAVRHALGASRRRLFRQLATEGLALAIAGCACGVLVALGTVRLLSASLPAMVPAFGTELNLTLDWRAIVFAILMSVVTGVITTVIPGRAPARADGLQMLKGEPVILARTWPLASIAQVAFSLLLVLVASSFVQRLMQLQTAPLGFSPEGRIYAYAFLSSADTTPESRDTYYRRAIERLDATPGISSVAIASALPLMPADAECVGEPSSQHRASVSAVSSRYFDTLGITMLAGAPFSTASVSSPPGVILNETLARRLWPGQTAVGHAITIGCESSRSELVLGVVRDSAVTAVGVPPQPHLYVPFSANDTSRLVAIVVHTTADNGVTTETMRRALVELGGGVRVYAVATLEQYVEHSYGRFTWMTRLLGALALLALLLAIAGLFGVMAHRVAQRTREIGIRMALGAARGRLFVAVVARGLSVVLIGLACGELLSLLVFGVVGAMQEGIAAPSAATHGLAAMLWLGAAAIACMPPAWRAARVDPLVALRYE
jgi:putative ABC transport system permease protein